MATYQPLSMIHVTFLVEFLDRNDHPCASFSWGKRILINPPLERRPRTTHTKQTVWTEVFRGNVQLIQGEDLELGRE